MWSNLRRGKEKELSSQELKELLAAVQQEMDRRQSENDRAARLAEKNARELQVREILRSAGVDSLASYIKNEADHRLYVNGSTFGRKWGGSRRYPVSFYLLVEGNEYEGAGWHHTVYPLPGVMEQIIEAVTEALALLGETPESAASKKGFHFYV